MSCHLLERGAHTDCDELPVGGTEDRLILINYDNVEFIKTLNGKITAIHLVAGAVGYEFFGLRQDIKKSEDAVNNGRLKTRFTHSTEFIVYEIDQIQKKNIQRMTKGRFMAIVENKGRHDDSFELLGRECGLKLTAGVLRDAYGTKGLYNISLSTPDNGIEYERKLPQTVGTSYQDGLDIIDDILDFQGIFDFTFDFTFE